MGLICQSKLTTLNSASDVKAVADTAFLVQEEMSVAHLINDAANCGQYNVVCNRILQPETVTKLENLGYTLKYSYAKANSIDEVIISWETPINT